MGLYLDLVAVLEGHPDDLFTVDGDAAPPSPASLFPGTPPTAPSLEDPEGRFQSGAFRAMRSTFKSVTSMCLALLYRNEIPDSRIVSGIQSDRGQHEHLFLMHSSISSAAMLISVSRSKSSLSRAAVLRNH